MARLDPMAESLVELRPVAGLVTTRSYSSLSPYAAGSGSPVVGVPMGRHLDTGATVCADPISWFRTARLISVPSMFLLGNPALGKSMSIRHWDQAHPGRRGRPRPGRPGLRGRPGRRRHGRQAAGCWRRRFSAGART